MSSRSPLYLPFPVLLSVLHLGCAHKSPAHGPDPAPARGSLADVKTPDGAYDGYVVERRCCDAGCVGVRGVGAAGYPGLEGHIGPGDIDAYRKAVDDYKNDLFRAIDDPTSFVSSAFGQACTGPGMRLGTSDSADIDRAIERIGAFFRARNLREEVAICRGSDEVDARADGAKQRGN